jgi:hypothetical protein
MESHGGIILIGENRGKPKNSDNIFIVYFTLSQLPDNRELMTG